MELGNMRVSDLRYELYLDSDHPLTAMFESYGPYDFIGQRFDYNEGMFITDGVLIHHEIVTELEALQIQLEENSEDIFDVDIVYWGNLLDNMSKGRLVVKMTSESDTAEVLITEIQARPALWNTKLASYKNKNLRDRLYTEVAEILDISIFRSGDPANHYKSNWPYFDMMSFLKDLLTPAVKSGNLPRLDELSQDDETTCGVEGDKDDETDTRSDMDLTDVNSPPSVSASGEERPLTSASALSSTSQQRKEKNRKRISDGRDEKFIEIENKKLKLLTQHLKNDADESESEELLFFKSLIPYMTKFNPIQKLKVRNKVQKVILDELETSENDKSRISQATTAQSNNLTLKFPQNPSPQHLLPPENPSHHQLLFSAQNLSSYHMLSPQNPSSQHLLPPENPSQHQLLSPQNPSPRYSTVSENSSTSSTPFLEPLTQQHPVQY
ncbi:hypothetical protein FQR65_LT15318 [Abscondita terminalis]|nr:hypothetical protein FQR65_LT15318 [Abscondita terminalis]